MERLTSRQTIRHADGSEHIETYCHGHRYGPAAFPHKYGTAAPEEYKNYCQMIDRLAAYEDTRLTPEAVKRVNTFAGSELEKMLVKNGELTRELEIAKKAICEMCQRRAQEQNIICGCAACKYGPKKVDTAQTAPRTQTPCDFCRHNPPFSRDGKLCSMCPVSPKEA